jgi:pimeloyl-ACP methyl ester carboxylesterase
MPTAELGDQLVNWRAEGDAPILYLHGVPNSSEMWAPFLKLTGGVAVDLPGFGRSGQRGDLDFSFEGLGRFVDHFVEHLGLDRVRLCMHDWGSVGLLWAMRQPERVERLVLIDAVTFLPGYRWHFFARQWRRRAVGELSMGFTNRAVASRLMPAELVDDALASFDQGTQRAILRLYRSADEDKLARAGKDLGRLTCPALVVWGADDPYIPAGFATAYAEALGGPANIEIAQSAGHWPWCDRPELVQTVADFLVR